MLLFVSLVAINLFTFTHSPHITYVHQNWNPDSPIKVLSGVKKGISYGQ